VVDALQDAVFPRGTIVVPTHKRPADVYNILETGCHTGAIPGTLRRLMLAEDLIKTAHELLDQDLGALLCDREQCPVCPHARETLPD